MSNVERLLQILMLTGVVDADIRTAKICGCPACQAYLAAAGVRTRLENDFKANLFVDVAPSKDVPPQPADKTTETTETTKKNTTEVEEIKDMTTTENATLLDVDVERTGEKIIVPPGIALKDAIAALTRRDAEEGQVIEVSHTFKMTASEGARLFHKTLNDLHGFVSPRAGVTMIAMDVGPNKTESVPWGRMTVPGIDGELWPDLYPMNGLYYFSFGGKVKGRDKVAVQRIADHMRAIAGKESLYHGKALRVSFPDRYSSIEDILPKFMDTDKVNPDALIFDRETEDLVDVALLTPIEHAAACRAHGISLKRGILLEGPFGVGKTLTAAVTARKCVENGWTFILLDDVSKLSRAIAFARQYQPAVIFAEDIDQVLKDEAERDDKINAILNQIDGIESKGTEVITVLTTNNVEDITQAMLRPGRIDTVIPVRAPDADAATRLVRMFAGALIDPTEDLSSVGPQLAGMIPASIAEVVNRSKLSAIRRAMKTGGDAKRIIAQDISIAAHGMAAHLELLKPIEEDDRSDLELAAEILGDKMAAAMQPRPRANGASEHVPSATRSSALGLSPRAATGRRRAAGR